MEKGTPGTTCTKCSTTSLLPGLGYPAYAWRHQPKSGKVSFDNYFTYWIPVYSLVSECRLEWCTNGNDLNKTFRWEVGWSLRYCRICIVGGPRLPDKRVEYANTGKLLLFGFCFYVRLRRENCDLNTTSRGVLIPGGVHTLLPALRFPACLRRTTVH